jgi:glycosyltransferase involved in cell wall biosynthesis
MNDSQGGAERVISDVSSGLAERDHEVSLLSFDKPGGQSFYPLNNKISRICLGIGFPLKKATFSETCIRMVALRRTVKKERPDVVVAFMHSMFIPMAFALIGTDIPVVASEHIVPKHYKSRRLEFLLLMASGFILKRITALSESVKALYPKFLQRRMVAMPNPVHAPTGSADPTGDGKDRKIILNVGRLDPQKDQKTLIAAFARLATDYPEWDVRIFGKGPLRGDMEEMIRQHELQGRVFLPGTTSEIAKEYQQAQIFALPSLYESFGLATAEAMSYGLPCIGFSDCNGTNELIIHEENGLLVTGAGRVESFANALEKLMSDAEFRVKLGRGALESTQQNSPEKVFDLWENLLRDEVS